MTTTTRASKFVRLNKQRSEQPADVTVESNTEDGPAPRPQLDVKKTVLNSGYAMLGVTGLALDRLRAVQQRATAVREDLTSRSVFGELKKVQQKVASLPTEVINNGLEAAERAEEKFEECANRGREIVDWVVSQDAAAGVVGQAQHVVDRGRRLVKDTKRVAAQAKRSVAEATGTARAGADILVEDVEVVAEEVKSSAAKAARRTASVAQEAVRDNLKPNQTDQPAADAAATADPKGADAPTGVDSAEHGAPSKVPTPKPATTGSAKSAAARAGAKNAAPRQSSKPAVK